MFKIIYTPILQKRYGRISIFGETKYKQGFYSNVLQQVNGLKNIRSVSSLIRSKLVTVLRLKECSDNLRLKVLTTYNKEKCYKKYIVTISSKIYKHQIGNSKTAILVESKILRKVKTIPGSSPKLFWLVFMSLN